MTGPSRQHSDVQRMPAGKSSVTARSSSRRVAARIATAAAACAKLLRIAIRARVGRAPDRVIVRQVASHADAQSEGWRHQNRPVSASDVEWAARWIVTARRIPKSGRSTRLSRSWCDSWSTASPISSRRCGYYRWGLHIDTRTPLRTTESRRVERAQRPSTLKGARWIDILAVQLDVSSLSFSRAARAAYSRDCQRPWPRSRRH